MRYVLCFGNPLLKEDSLARLLAKRMRVPNHSFIECDAPTELANYHGKDIIILDVANVPEPMLIEDLDRLQEPKLVSLHDFDLAFFLKLQQGLSRKPRPVRIIAVPKDGDINLIEQQTATLLKSVR